MNSLDTNCCSTAHCCALVTLTTSDCCSLDCSSCHFDRHPVDKDNPNKSVLDWKSTTWLHPNRMDMEHLSMGNDWQMSSDTTTDRTTRVEVSSGCHYCSDRRNIRRRTRERRDRSCSTLAEGSKVNWANHRDGPLAGQSVGQSSLTTRWELSGREVTKIRRT